MALQRTILAGLIFAGLKISAPLAAEGDDFYRGKTLTLSISAGVGGGFDTYGRTVAEHLGKFIPGKPVVTPDNRVGAGGRVAANWLYNLAPKDGSVIALLGGWIPFEPLWEIQGVQFDPSKFLWLGNANREVSTCLYWNRNGIDRFDVLKARETLTASYGPQTAQTQDVIALNAFAGTKIKVIHGYSGTNESVLAAERGEVDGTCGIWASSVKSAYQRYIKDGSMRAIVQMGAQDHPDLPGVPNAIRELKSIEDRQSWDLIFGQLEIARSFAAPPGTPPSRVAILRKAFDDLFADPGFLAAAQQRGLEIRPLSGEQMHPLIGQILATPKPIVARVKKLLDY